MDFTILAVVLLIGVGVPIRNKLIRKYRDKKKQEDNNKSIDILEGISILLERMCMEEVPESIEKFGVDDWYRYSNFKRFNKFF